MFGKQIESKKKPDISKSSRENKNIREAWEGSHINKIVKENHYKFWRENLEVK